LHETQDHLQEPRDARVRTRIESGFLLQEEMKTKQQKQFETWAMPRLVKIQKVLLLEHFHPIDLQPNGKDSTSECLYSHPYQSINVRYSNDVLKNFKEKKYNDVLNVLVHEMCHPLTDPLYGTGFERFVTKEQLENEREKLTDHLANILLKNKLV
jgi:hypothetical protein